jgi:hypothetical protein
MRELNSSRNLDEIPTESALLHVNVPDYLAVRGVATEFKSFGPADMSVISAIRLDATLLLFFFPGLQIANAALAMNGHTSLVIPAELL